MDRLKKFGTWLWSGLGNIVMLVTWAISFALPAWAINATQMFTQYRPFSWVLAGFGGVLLISGGYALIALARYLYGKAEINRAFHQPTLDFNPMDHIFERKRIRISDLVLPFEQVVQRKKFLNCELVGPSNILLITRTPGATKLIGNRFEKHDAIAIRADAVPAHAITFADCDFEDCVFYNVSLLIFTEHADAANLSINNLHWITESSPKVALTA